MSQLYHPPVRMASTLILTRRDVRQALTLDDSIAAVEAAFGLVARGGVPRPGVSGFHVEGGGFHVKTAMLPLSRLYFAAKLNGNFPDNPARRGLPTIQGVIALSDASNGVVLAVMDSMEITTLRTAAATAVAARHLARAGARTTAIAGCGIQGRASLRAVSRVREIESAWAFDVDPQIADAFAREMSAELGIPVSAIRDLGEAREADIWVTCTPSRHHFLGPAHVAPGAFVAGVGTDSEHKQELDPALLAANAVVVDVREQCAAIGDLHHALDAGVMRMEDVRADLGEVVAGLRPGRLREDEIIIFDSTGTALQDVAAAALVYERAKASGAGLEVALAEG